MSLSLQVTALNDRYISNASVSVVCEPKVVDKPDNLRVIRKTRSSVTLNWNHISKIDGFIISHNRPENIFMSGEMKYNSTESTYEGKLTNGFCR